ncbi:MAG: metallophosphoesterase, partial [Steroidobacteraceae bacterium]
MFPSDSTPARWHFSAVLRHVLALAIALPLATSALAADADYRLDGVRRVVVVPDVHGGYQELLSVLRETAVIDESLHWRGGDTHLVSLGDLIDRGPDSRKVLDLFMRLEREAPDAGGDVHVLLGNHEVMNIVGDLRYVTDVEYAAFSGSDDDRLREAEWRLVVDKEPAASRAEFDSKYPAGYFARRQAFSSGGQYGAWLLPKPFLLVINDTALVHGGLPEMVARLGLDGTNESLRLQLSEYLRTWQSTEEELGLARPSGFLERPEIVAARGAEQQSKALAALQDAEIFTPKGPTWYRGQALCYPYAEADNLAAALERLGVSRLVVGHTVSPTGRVISRFDGRVILLDT